MVSRSCRGVSAAPPPPGSQGFFLLPGDALDAAVGDWFKFAFAASQSRGTLRSSILSSILRELNLAIAYGIDLYLFSVYLPRFGAFQPLRELKVSRRRCRRDPMELTQVLEKSGAIYGSSRVAIGALTGTSSYDHRLVHCHNTLYLQTIKDTCRRLRSLSIAFDLGTYGGESTCCGVAYNQEADIAWALPIKALLTCISSVVGAGGGAFLVALKFPCSVGAPSPRNPPRKNPKNAQKHPKRPQKPQNAPNTPKTNQTNPKSPKTCQS